MELLAALQTVEELGLAAQSSGRPLWLNSLPTGKLIGINHFADFVIEGFGVAMLWWGRWACGAEGSARLAGLCWTKEMACDFWLGWV
jgi:hypothetical protein